MNGDRQLVLGEILAGNPEGVSCARSVSAVLRCNGWWGSSATGKALGLEPGRCVVTVAHEQPRGHGRGYAVPSGPRVRRGGKRCVLGLGSIGVAHGLEAWCAMSRRRRSRNRPEDCLPCPFCRYDRPQVCYFRGGTALRVWCPDCGAAGPEEKGGAESRSAVEAWNCRATAG